GGGEAVFGCGAEEPGRFAQQKGPQPLAALQRAMPHGAEQPAGRLSRSAQPVSAQKRIERPLDLGGVVAEPVVETCHCGGSSQKARRKLLRRMAGCPKWGSQAGFCA